MKQAEAKFYSAAIEETADYSHLATRFEKCKWLKRELATETDARQLGLHWYSFQQEKTKLEDDIKRATSELKRRSMFALLVYSLFALVVRGLAFGLGVYPSAKYYLQVERSFIGMFSTYMWFMWPFVVMVMLCQSEHVMTLPFVLHAGDLGPAIVFSVLFSEDVAFAAIYWPCLFIGCICWGYLRPWNYTKRLLQVQDIQRDFEVP